MNTCMAVKSCFVLETPQKLGMYTRLILRKNHQDLVLRLNLDGTGVLRITSRSTRESTDVPVAIFDATHLCLFSENLEYLSLLRSILLSASIETNVLTVLNRCTLSYEDVAPYSGRLVLSNNSSGIAFTVLNEYTGQTSIIRISRSGLIQFSQTSSADQICVILNAAIRIMEKTASEDAKESALLVI